MMTKDQIEQMTDEELENDIVMTSRHCANDCDVKTLEQLVGEAERRRDAALLEELRVEVWQGATGEAL